MKTIKELNSNQQNGNGEIDDINNLNNNGLVHFFLKSIGNASTLDHYGRYLRIFLEFVDEYPVKDIKPYHLIQFLEQREKDVGKLRKTTKKSYLTSISSFYNYLKINDFAMGGNPALAALKDPIVKNAKNIQYTPLKIEEIKKILQGITSPRETAIILTLFKTGCRIGECTNLLLSDVDLDKNIITIRNRKAHSEEDEGTKIPIDAELSATLKNWLYFRPKDKSDHLFVSYYGMHMTITRMRDIVVKCGENAGIPKAHSHRYRYSFTTTLSNERCNQSVIAYLRGDSPKTMTQYYTKPSQEYIREEYLRAMPKLL